MKFSEFYLCFHNSCEINDNYFQAPMRNSVWCYYNELITGISIALEKYKKESDVV